MDPRLTQLHTEAEAEPDVNGQIDESIVPEQLLQPGEIIILLLKPSCWYIILASLRELTIATLIFAIALTLERGGYFFDGRRDLFYTYCLIVAAILIWRFLDWLARAYILTDRRIIRVRGVIRVNVFETSLKQIQHTNTTFSLRERIFGLGTIGFATAGTDIIDAYWLMVAEPLEVHRKVVQAMNRYG